MWRLHGQRHMAFHIGRTEKRPRWKDVIFSISCDIYSTKCYGMGKKIKDAVSTNLLIVFTDIHGLTELLFLWLFACQSKALVRAESKKSNQQVNMQHSGFQKDNCIPLSRRLQQSYSPGVTFHFWLSCLIFSGMTPPVTCRLSDVNKMIKDSRVQLFDSSAIVCHVM